MRIIKLMRNLVFLFVIFVILLFIFREPVIKNAVIITAKGMTGFSVDVRQLKVGLFRPVIKIDGLKVQNPADFEVRVMLDMPQIYVSYVPRQLVEAKVHLTTLKIDLEEFQVVKNAKGETNVGRLKAVADSMKGKEEEKKPAAAPAKPSFQIDTLQLKVGRVVFKDYSVTPPATKTYNVNINKEFRGISSSAGLMRLIVVESLLKTNLSGLLDFNFKALEDNVKGLLAAPGAMMKKTAGVATDAATEAVGTTKTVVKKTFGIFGNILSPKKEEIQP